MFLTSLSSSTKLAGSSASMPVRLMTEIVEMTLPALGDKAREQLGHDYEQHASEKEKAQKE
jgi:hypothetical protein